MKEMLEIYRKTMQNAQLEKRVFGLLKVQHGIQFSKKNRSHHVGNRGLSCLINRSSQTKLG